MNEHGTLQEMIKQYEQADQHFRQARENMRMALRAYLRVKAEGSRHGTIAKKLAISTQQLSNLKLGYSVPSSTFAKRLLKVGGETV